MNWPVIQRLSGEARKAATSAMSSGCQRHGVIPESVGADKTAEMFVLLSLGLRVRSSIPLAQASFNNQDYSSFMVNILNPDK
jgi:hypothetical protein